MIDSAGAGGSRPVHVVYLRYWREWLRAYWARLLLVLALMLVVGVAGAGYAKFMERAISALESGDASVAYWGPAGIIALTCVKGLCDYARKSLVNLVVSKIQAAMQSKMYRSLLFMDLSSLLAESPASLSVRFSADLQVARNSISELVGVLSAVLTILATLAIMASIDWVMTIAIVAIFALAIAPVGFVGTRIKRISAWTQREIAGMTAAVHEGLSGIRMIRTYRLESRLQASADRAFLRLRKLNVSLENRRLSVAPLIEVLGGFAIAALILLVSYRISAGALDLAGFVGLLTGFGVIMNPAQKLGAAYTVAKQGQAAFERVFGLFDSRNMIRDGTREFAPGERARGAIRFVDVDFVYPDGFHAVKKLRFDIEPGRTFAFVGRSGAGKSTVFNLIPRLFDVSGGCIEIDGADIRDYTLAALRDQISVVSQESVLLNGTVLENIAFGSSGATGEAVIAAARSAGAHEFIKKLPDGYETMVEPAQQAFSGGEKQRLSIARAILRDAPILLLDEPTSALDARSESVIREALSRLASSRTTLVIAHRLSTILDADQIVVMDAGKIVDQGTHQELLERGGTYAELYNLQFEPRALPKNDRLPVPSRIEDRKDSQSFLSRLARFLGA